MTYLAADKGWEPEFVAAMDLLLEAEMLMPVERCGHKKYDAHWVTGPCFCGRHPVTKEKGMFGPRGLQDEYSPVVWEPCTHEWCPGAATEDNDDSAS